MAADDTMCCASCGQAEIDDIKLKKCNDGCNLVRYCSDGCQENHREQHEEECKKRVGELRDRDLFEQPDGTHYLGECPICFLPLPDDLRKCTFMPCCSKRLCEGCCYANQTREFEAGLKMRCAFCREPVAKSDEESDKRVMKRIKKNDPEAMNYMGKKHYHEGNYETAFEYLTNAAGLGDAGAHYNLSCLYRDGKGVEKDTIKQVYHLEEAAIGGDPAARHNLGCIEAKSGSFERAKKHLIIAANLGHQNSLNGLRLLYADGHASKEDYASALRAYQTAVEATKSAEREKAEAFYKALRHG